MNPDSATQDCDHRTCRILALMRARGRRPPKRCRNACSVLRGVVSLDQLGPGQVARVVRVGGRPVERRRLLELGIVRGEPIRLQRVAPLGDPREFVVKGYHLSLRRREASRITVEIEEPAAGAPAAGPASA
jgi:ferrous iron transport protein A